MPANAARPNEENHTCIFFINKDLKVMITIISFHCIRDVFEGVRAAGRVRQAAVSAAHQKEKQLYYQHWPLKHHGVT